jgi:hypothetical protein
LVSQSLLDREFTMETQLNWLYFLKMIGSERGLAYWRDLKIPIERSHYNQCNRFAKGVLELIIFPYVLRGAEIYDFRHSWTEYSKSGCVLNNEFLEKYKIEDITEEDIRTSSLAVARLLDFTGHEIIYQWFFDYHKYSADSIIEAPRILEFLLKNNPSFEAAFEIENVLKKDDLSKLLNFCKQIRLHNKYLDTHFFIANNVFRTQLPNEWEIVLGNFLNEGYPTTDYWTDSVLYSLKYVNFFNGWRELKKLVGLEAIGIIISYLEINLENNKELLSAVVFQFNERDLARLKNL